MQTMPSNLLLGQGSDKKDVCVPPEIVQNQRQTVA